MQRQRACGAVGPVLVASFPRPGQRQSIEFSVVGWRCQSMLVEIGGGIVSRVWVVLAAQSPSRWSYVVCGHHRQAGDAD